MKNNLVIFTDLDGTLLDSDYSFKKALPALTRIKKNHIPLIFCSSKTRAEIEHYRKKLQNTYPFISENGGGIFIPRSYFRYRIQVEATLSEDSHRDTGFKIQEKYNYYIIRLGAKYPDLRKALAELRLDGFEVRGFGDMSIKEIAELSGLKTNEARMAKQREFDEPFIFNGSKKETKRLLLNIKKKGFNYTQGEFFHIMGNSNKGRAVDILIKLYTKQYHKLITAGVGDSPNDIEMLEKVDYPIIVKKSDGSYNLQLIRKFKRIKKLIKADSIGPEGWNYAINNLLSKLLITPITKEQRKRDYTD